MNDWVIKGYIQDFDTKNNVGRVITHSNYPDVEKFITEETVDKLFDLGKLSLDPPPPDSSYIIQGFIPYDDMGHLLNHYKTGKQRGSWDQYFMEKAEHASSRATCLRLAVGAVLVIGKRDIITGYNGSGEGEPHCTDVGCLMHEDSCKRTTHAEMNVIDMCAKEGIPMKGATLYVTHYPCPYCMQHIANVGITEVVYKHFYRHKFINNFGGKLTIRQFVSDEHVQNRLEFLNDQQWSLSNTVFRLDNKMAYGVQLINKDGQRAILSLDNYAKVLKSGITIFDKGFRNLDYIQVPSNHVDDYHLFS